MNVRKLEQTINEVTGRQCKVFATEEVSGKIIRIKDAASKLEQWFTPLDFFENWKKTMYNIGGSRLVRAVEKSNWDAVVDELIYGVKPAEVEPQPKEEEEPKDINEEYHKKKK